jgi:hypothetical protein
MKKNLHPGVAKKVNDVGHWDRAGYIKVNIFFW